MDSFIQISYVENADPVAIDIIYKNGLFFALFGINSIINHYFIIRNERSIGIGHFTIPAEKLKGLKKCPAYKIRQGMPVFALHGYAILTM
ncbi:MAG: hypothetical protein R2764_05495 [Bacteroidales bacterium]